MSEVKEEATGPAPAVPAAAAPPAPAPFPTLPADYPALVSLMEDSREPRLAHVLHDVVRLVDYSPPVLTIVAPSDLGPGFAQQLMLALGKATGGTRWTVTLARDGGAPTLHEQAEARIQATRDARRGDGRSARAADPRGIPRGDFAWYRCRRPLRFAAQELSRCLTWTTS